MKERLLFFCCLFYLQFGMTQDAFFYETNQIRGFLNPALAGINGALSFTVLGKEQYLNQVGDFATTGISVTQSWPCVKVDAGLYYIFDREGEGLFATHHTGFNFVYTVPFDIGATEHNLRLGTKFQYSRKTIDWERLTFSDQIDSKYNLTDAFGIPNTTDFVPPDWNGFSRLTMGLGIIHRVTGGFINRWSLTWGISLENYTNALEGKAYDSILRLEKEKTRLIDKWSFYLAPEFPLTGSYRDYFGLRPSLVVLQESSLTNIQLGAEVNYRRAYGLGLYVGSGQLRDFSSDSKSLIMNTYFRAFSTPNAQFNMGFQYVHGIGGLSEVFGQTLQVTLSYTFRQDGCASTPSSKIDCPPVSLRNKIMYENIWFSPLQGINK